MTTKKCAKCEQDKEPYCCKDCYEDLQSTMWDYAEAAERDWLKRYLLMIHQIDIQTMQFPITWTVQLLLL